MGKKSKMRGEEGAPPGPSLPLLSRRGWKILGIGVALVVIGYIVLSFSDPWGRNWASRLSPFLLIGGYASIGFGILARDPGPSSPPRP